jgi:hypothetical protein
MLIKRHNSTIVLSLSLSLSLSLFEYLNLTEDDYQDHVLLHKRSRESWKHYLSMDRSEENSEMEKN